MGIVYLIHSPKRGRNKLALREKMFNKTQNQNKYSDTNTFVDIEKNLNFLSKIV